MRKCRIQIQDPVHNVVCNHRAVMVLGLIFRSEHVYTEFSVNMMLKFTISKVLNTV